MTKNNRFSPMFVCSYALLPCILDLESTGCHLTSVLCFLSSTLCPLSSINWPLIPKVIVRKYLRLYICKDTFTNVMSALQIELFMQNKAKFKKVKSNVNKVLTWDYDQMDTWSIRTKQSQTNPNKAKSNPILANKTPIRTQFKPKQIQFQRQKSSSGPNDRIRQLPISHKKLSDICRLTAELIGSKMTPLTF